MYTIPRPRHRCSCSSRNVLPKLYTHLPLLYDQSDTRVGVRVGRVDVRVGTLHTTRLLSCYERAAVRIQNPVIKISRRRILIVPSLFAYYAIESYSYYIGR